MTVGLSEYEAPAHTSYTSCYSNFYSPLPSPGRQYAEARALDSVDRDQQGGLEAAEQGLLWHEDSKPGTLV